MLSLASNLQPLDAMPRETCSATILFVPNCSVSDRRDNLLSFSFDPATVTSETKKLRNLHAMLWQQLISDRISLRR